MITKKIHIPWPTFCKMRLKEAQDQLNTVMESLDYLDREGCLVLSLKNAIIATQDAERYLDDMFGKDE